MSEHYINYEDKLQALGSVSGVVFLTVFLTVILFSITFYYWVRQFVNFPSKFISAFRDKNAKPKKEYFKSMDFIYFLSLGFLWVAIIFFSLTFINYTIKEGNKLEKEVASIRSEILEAQEKAEIPILAKDYDKLTSSALVTLPESEYSYFFGYDLTKVNIVDRWWKLVVSGKLRIFEFEYADLGDSFGYLEVSHVEGYYDYGLNRGNYILRAVLNTKFVSEKENGNGTE